MKSAFSGLGWLVVGIFCCCAVARAASQEAAYGTIQHYSNDTILSYPDFQLQYLGKRRFPVGSETPRHPIIYFHDFQVLSKDKRQKISWSSGTGDIAPSYFKVSDSCFAIELAMSDSLGQLQSSELVVQRVSDASLCK